MWFILPNNHGTSHQGFPSDEECQLSRSSSRAFVLENEIISQVPSVHCNDLQASCWSKVGAVFIMNGRFWPLGITIIQSFTAVVRFTGTEQYFKGKSIRGTEGCLTQGRKLFLLMTSPIAYRHHRAGSRNGITAVDFVEQEDKAPIPLQQGTAP